MTWDAYHRRKTALREILAVADRERGTAPDDLLDAVPGTREVFQDGTDLLLDVQMAWFQRLSGQMDRVDLLDGTDPEALVTAAWAAAAAEMPGARTLLDAQEHRSELATAMAKERAYLGQSAGVPGQGRRLLEQARDRTVLPPAPDPEADRHGLMARLRSALAA